MGRNYLLVILLSGLASLCTAKTYNKILPVGPSQAYSTIQAAVNACQASERCEIQVDAGTYNEQVTFNGKRNIWLHASDTTNIPTIRFLDTVSTQPKDKTNGDGSDNWAYYSERNGVIRVISNSDSIRISHLIIDAVRHFSFQWQNVWGSLWQFSGNGGIAITGSHATQVDHCEILNAWWGIRIKDRNTGAVYASLDQWEIEQNVASATPFSDFGKSGNHLFEYNRLHNNVWGFYAEQTWDLPSTIRYNLVYNNAADTSKDFVCSDKSVCGVPANFGGDRQYHAGGFFFLKDAMLVSHMIYNNTLYSNPQTIAGYFKAGKNHIVFNNIIDQHLSHIENYPAVAQTINLFGGYGNAHNNVLSENGRGTFPLFGGVDTLWVAKYLKNGATAPVDSFLYPAGHDNFWYKVPEFQSTDPANPLFLCPNWASAQVSRTIAGKAWAQANSVGTTDLMGIYTPDAQDVGALWQNGTGCQSAGVHDSIGIQLQTISPILFYNLSDARFQFKVTALGAPDSDFTEITYHYSAYVDSMPFVNNTSQGVYTEEHSPVPGLIGLLHLGLNDQTFAFPRTSFGEFGMIRFSVHAKHKNGKTYVSNLEVVEYRRLKNTLKLQLFDKQGVEVDTVSKGDTVTVKATILDINLNTNSDAVVLSSRANFIQNSGANWIDYIPSTFVGIGNGKFVIRSYTGANEILTVGGVVGEINGPGDTSKYFITGTTPFYIKPSNASALTITNTSLTAPQNEPMLVTVDVRDVFGTLSEEPVNIRLTSSQGDLVSPVPQVCTNSNGKITFAVTPTGAIGSKFTLVASIDGSEVQSAPVTFIITPPTNRKVTIVNRPDEGHHFATGEVIPVHFRLVDGSGNPLQIQDYFMVTLRDGKGIISDLPSLYYDSLQAASPTAASNNQGQFAMTLPSSGEITVYFKWPADLDTSDSYSLQTTNVNGSTLFDVAKYNVDVPQLVFVDLNGIAYNTPPPIDTVTGYLMPLSLQERINGIICTQCNDKVFTAPNNPFIHFKATSNGGDITTLQLNNGVTDFFVYATHQVLNGEFTLYARDSVATVLYDSLIFRKPPVPQADSASVFDTNGDGIGDSLVIWYAEPIADSLPDTLLYAWPSTGATSTLVPSSKNVLAGSNNILVITGNLTDYILTAGSGKLNSLFQDADGQWWNQRLDIQDRMGPVLISVSLIQCWTPGFDTLQVVFSEALDSNEIQGTAFVINGNVSLPLSSHGIQKNDSTWIFLVDKNRVAEGDAMALYAGAGTPLVDIKANAPSTLNRSVLVSLILRPVPPAQKGNLFQDLNGDGTLDHITISLLGPVDSSYLQNELDSLVFTWVDSSGAVISIAVPGSSFTIDPNDAKKLQYDIADIKALYPFLTSINTERFGEYGTATMYATIASDPQTIMPVNMIDAMPPVIREASLDVADKAGEDDVLTIWFSEPVQIPSGISDQDLFDFKAKSSSDVRILQYSDISWKSDQEVTLSFGKGISMDMRPSSQDSIRIHAGSLEDYQSNVVPSESEFAKQSPDHSTPPFKLIVGDFRFKLTTVTMSQYNPADPLLQSLDPTSLVIREFGTQVDKSQDYGMVLDFGSIDLQSTVQRAIKQKFYARDSSLLIEDIEIDPAKIKLSVQLDIFTNMGSFVARHAETVTCGSELFSGNCIVNPKQVFTRWNFQSQEGRFVGSGAYFAQMHIKVWYDGSSSVKVTELTKLETWGLRRLSGSHGLRTSLE